jgi:heat shock protein HslJ
MRKMVFVILLAGLILTACTADQPGTPVAGTWDVVSYGAASNLTPALPDLDHSVIFGGDGKLSGNVGCNTFSGSYAIEGGKINFQPMVSTKLACVPDLVMKQEQAVLQILSGIADFKTTNRNLTITNNGATLVLQVGGN